MHYIYAAIYLTVAFADAIIALKCFVKNTQAGKMLGVCMYGAALVSITYLVSILASNYYLATICNLLSLCIIDIMIAYLICFFLALIYGDFKRSKPCIWMVRLFMIVCVADIISILLNPIYGHVATYTFASTEHIPHYYFEGHAGYFYHLLLCYTMLAFGFLVLIFKSTRIPRIYRSPILRTILCVLVIALMNVFYVLNYAATTADLTLIFYSVLGYLVYLNAFVYGHTQALQQTAKNVLDSSNQPIVVFDYKDDLFLYNPAAYDLFPELSLNPKDVNFTNFVESIAPTHDYAHTEGKARFYWTPPNQLSYSYICDIQRLTDKKGKMTAHSLVFTNNTLSVDQLTGFLTEQYFNSHQEELESYGEAPIVFGVCDLNQLALLNNVLGYHRGDDAIELLANTMRKHLPENTLFVRLQDAKLSCICFNAKTDDIKNYLNLVNEDIQKADDFNMRIKMDFAVVDLEEGETLKSASIHALSILSTRKLLDSESRHSNGIESLTKMLAECDGETEGHVQRTRVMGDSLAFELGLSDYERDQLSLLCLFHDIGKVGIPSSILNKPGKLTDAERAIVQEHVQKGYRIARSTPGLEIVAEPILHHHENWDGTGYPDGMQHESIPVLSRIISVVDSYDAMTSDRPYHQGMSPEKACEELIRCSGTQFDPYIVDTFVRLISKNSKDVTASISPVTAVTTDATSETGRVLPSKSKMIAPVTYSEYHLNSSERIENVDKNFEELTGYTTYDVENMQLTQSDLLFEEDIEAYWKEVNKCKKSGPIVYLEHRIKRKDGTGRYVYCIGLSDESYPDRHTKIVMTDITDSTSMKQQVNLARNRAMMSIRRLEETIQLDPLTSLLNQTAFRKSCERELLDKQNRCVLVMMDLDDFKGYNDRYGHPKGDELLIEVSQALSSVTWGNDIVGRLGGDEFACLLRYSADSSLATIKENVEDFWTRLNEERERRGIQTTLSAGAALAEQGEVDFNSLYTRADEYMYKSKKKGKSQIYLGKEKA